MVQNTYFHCAPLKLGAGSIIEVGNWGRMFQFHNWELLTVARDYREIAYEYGRLKYAPRAPSRLNCVFVCETEIDARNYSRQNSHTAVIHQVELVDAAAPLHYAKWSLLNLSAQDGISPFQSLEQDIQCYWQGIPDTDVEVLIGGAVRVVRAL